MIRENGELRLEPEDARLLALSSKLCAYARYGIFCTLRQHGKTNTEERGLEWLVLYQLMLSWRGKKGGTSLKNYLGRYAHYVARKYCYKDARARSRERSQGLLFSIRQKENLELDWSDFQVLENALENLDDRTKLIIYSRFWLDKTLQEIGDALGLTRERVRQLEEIGLTRLRRILQRAYIEKVEPFQKLAYGTVVCLLVA
jgi:RNA polymerase sigma factor (sigma-70 family)